MERLKRKKLDPRHHGPHRAYVHAKGLRLEPLVDACIAAESTAAALLLAAAGCALYCCMVDYPQHCCKFTGIWGRRVFP